MPSSSKRVARELLGARRVERDVQELGAVAVGAEHVGRDEARAGEIALVAEDAVELERMSDRLVDLQHHLVGRQQDVHRPDGQFGASEQLQRLFGDTPTAACEAETLEDFDAALLADAALAVQRALLRDAVGMRGHADRRIQVAVATARHRRPRW